MRFLAAPWVGMLETGAWLRNAEHGNACARRLREQIAGVPGLEIMFPVQANAVFVRMVDENREEIFRFRIVFHHGQVSPGDSQQALGPMEVFGGYFDRARSLAAVLRALTWLWKTRLIADAYEVFL